MLPTRIIHCEVYHFFRDELEAQYMQFIPIVERATPETLPLADLGWSERPGGERPLYTQRGEPGHRTLGELRAIWSLLECYL